MSLKFTSTSFGLVLAAAFAGSLSATVVTYPGFNVSLTSPASTATNTNSTITLDSTGVFQNNGSDNPGNATYTRYYSGTLDFGSNGIGTWEVAQFRLLRSDNETIVTIGASADGQDTLSASVANGGSYSFSGGSIRAPLNFQIRISAAQYNTQMVSMWFLTSAIAGTEGTPDFTAGTLTTGVALSVSTSESKTLNQARLFLGTENWNHSTAESFSLSGFTSSNAWIVTAIPEPSAYAALAGLGAVGLVALRRRRRA